MGDHAEVKPTIAVHGGAGGGEPEHLEVVRAALHAGLEVLAGGGHALDAVCAAVVVFEDDGRFNAGRGAVPTSHGTIELDAAVMDGTTRAAGAVAAMTCARNPVRVGRALLDRGGAVLLTGSGADRFAHEAGCDTAPDGWFVRADTASSAGTVGAVAVDERGAFAAATSTGGMSGQRPGRVGDTPIIGAGTYANEHCAVSGTGTGEAFMRAVFSYRVAAALAEGASLRAACDDALADVTDLGGAGGCVAIAADAVVLRSTTDRMPSGWASIDGDGALRLSADV